MENLNSNTKLTTVIRGIRKQTTLQKMEAENISNRTHVSGRNWLYGFRQVKDTDGN
jgi:hypothetical protein